MKFKQLKQAFSYALFIVIVHILFLYLFGPKHTLVGLILGLGNIIFLKRDFTARFTFRFLSFLAINLTLGVFSYLAHLNLYAGFILNFLTVFLTTYAYMNDFRQPTSFIFLMSYIFMYSIPITLTELPIRLLAITTSIIIIMFTQFIFNRNKFNQQSDAIIKTVISQMNQQIDHILNDCYDHTLSIQIHGKIRTLMILIKERSHAKFKHNLVELNMFNSALCLSRLNLLISSAAMKKKSNTTCPDFFFDLQIQLNHIERFYGKIESFEEIQFSLNEFIQKHQNLRSCERIVDNVSYVLLIFIESLNNSKDYQESTLGNIYRSINVSSSFNFLASMKEHLNFKSLRFRYSLRLATAISMAIFMVSYLQLAHPHWVVISIYVVLQPYSEDSVSKAKKRFIGVTLGVTVYFIVFSLVHDKIPVSLILLAVLTGYFYFTEYSKKVMMMTLVALTSISLVDQIAVLSVSRFLLVFIGICLALLFNKYLLPYNKEDSILELTSKYKKNTKLIIKSLNEIKNGQDTWGNLLKYSIIHTQIEQKLIQDSNKNNTANIEQLIYNQNINLNSGKYEFLKYYYHHFYQKN